MPPQGPVRTGWRDLRDSRRQDRAFKEVWTAFNMINKVADGRHDSPEWGAHSGVFAACVVRVPASALAPELDNYRQALAPFEFVRIHPDHFLHIMLQEIGFVAEPPVLSDDISGERLEEYASAAADIASEFEPFEIELGGANSFQDAAFLDVHDRGRCARIHIRLREAAAFPSVPQFPFLPHVTVAHYCDDVEAGDLAGVIAKLRDLRFGTFHVDSIEIVTLALDEPYPPLKTHAKLPLGK